jgi:hypothetical protein
MRRHAIALVATGLVLAPLGARAADLVVWWEKGYYAQEDEAVWEIHRVAANAWSPLLAAR